MSWLVLLVSTAHAVCPAGTDNDTDQFCNTSGPDHDCDDADDTVHPGRQEQIGNGQDEDCDGHDALERFYVASAFSSWSASAGVTHTPDTVSIPNGGFLTRSTNTDAFRGKMHVVVSASVTAAAGDHCALEIETRNSAGLTTDGIVLSSGVTTYLLNNASGLASPGTRKISRITFDCDAAASMTLDWLSIQNSNSVYFPPSPDAEVAWEDLDITGGGRHNAVRKSESGLLFAAGDGGVAIWDPLDASDEWTFASGFGNGGIPTYQRYVADVAAVDWDEDGLHEVFALSGQTVIDTLGNADTIGGLWRSEDDGQTWEPVEDSYGVPGHLAPAYDDDVISCPGGGTIDGGGQKLLADEVTEVLYVASHRDHDLYGSDPDPEPDDAVLLWGQVSGAMCAPDFALPDDQTLSALAFAEGLSDGVPLLLVGYRSPGTGVTGLYACDVGDAYAGPSVTCATTGTIACSPVADTEGWDVRDIEVDPATGMVYVATGRADEVSCQNGTGQVFELDFDAFDATEIDAAAADLSTTWSADFVFGDRDVTGVSVDPSGTYLYAVVPGTEEGILRLDLLDTTLSWARMGENQSERDEKRAMMDTGSGWLGGNQLIEQASYVPEVRDTIAPIDLTWFTSWDEELVDGVMVETTATHALLLGWKGLWDIDGIDEEESGAFHPAYDAEWALTPRVDNWNGRTWGTVGPTDIEVDADGNVWMATPEQLGFLAWSDPVPLSGTQSGAEQECLVERYDADGSSVSIGMDGTVWVSLVDTSGGTPQDIGIWKRATQKWVEPEGEMPGFWANLPQWWYQGGGWDQEGSGDAADIERVTDELSAQYNDGLCEWPPGEPFDFDIAWDDGAYGGPVVKALGTEGGGSGDPNGAFFTEQDLTRTGNTWGNPRVVAALDGMIAVAAFDSYISDGGTAVSGRLAYTIDGGHNWATIDTVLDLAGTDYEMGCGVMSEFYDETLSMVMLGRGRDSYWDDLDSDGVVDAGEWAVRLMVGSAGSSTAGCMMAEVVLDENEAYWDWHGNTPTADVAGCRVTHAGFDGLTAATWSDEIFFWGAYSATYPGATPNGWLEYGGVCALDLDTGTITPVISPSTSERTYEYQFADVAASPNVSDLLLVTGRQTPQSVMECREPVGTGSLASSFCPSATPPLLVTRDASGTWKATPLHDVPPSDAGLAASWAVGESEWMYLSTEHSGAWKGTVSW